jgi:signal transduction histidine kinase
MLLLALVAINTYISQATISKLTALHSEIALATNTVTALEEMHGNVLKAESGQRGYLLNQNEAYLKHYNDAVTNLQASLSHSQTQHSIVPAQARLISSLKTLIQTKVDELSATVRIAQKGDFARAVAIVNAGDGRENYAEIHRLFEEIKSNTNAIAAAQVTKLALITKESARNLSVFFATSLLLLIGLFFLAKLNIKNQRTRELEMEAQNDRLQLAVDERTKELSLFSDELSRSNRELEDFAFVASHDLQEPLRKIMAFGDRLETQAQSLSDKQRDYLYRMRGAASRMSRLISDLLEFSRISTRGKSFQTVALNEVLQDCVDDLNVLIEETDVVIDIAPLPSISADPTQMHQLLFNLLANAIKFSQTRSSPMVSISIKPVAQPASIEVEGLSNWVCIAVSDNGIGFDQEYAQKIFAPFQRLHSRQAFKGSGIGLAICRRIVERHNGEIAAISEIDKGAVFTVTLPINNYLISIKQ